MKSWQLLALGIVFGGSVVFVSSSLLNPKLEASTALQPAASSPPTTAIEEPSDPASTCHLGVVIAEREIDVAAEGVGSLLTIEVQVGDVVRRGMALASLDPKILEHEIESERAALEVALAERELRQVQERQAEQELQRRRRLTDLIAAEEVARTESEHAETGALLASADAEILRARAHLARLRTLLKRSTLVAPFDGVVAARYLDPGARVGLGTPVVRLIGSGARRIRFGVPAEQALAFQRDRRVRVEVLSPERGQGILSATTVSAAATVSRQAPQVDAASRLIFVEADLPSEIDWPVGIPAQVSETGRPGNCSDFLPEMARPIGRLETKPNVPLAH